ncbi:MAG: DMT family transporter [Candidatus Hodarchaeales archaeon]|jgi:drug/metabolite transporter (DMT)-like permease
MSKTSPESAIPQKHPSNVFWALGAALFTTFLWSTSYVAIKIGLEQEKIPPLSFAALRYLVGFLILGTIWYVRKDNIRSKTDSRIPQQVLVLIAIMGIAGYALEPGLRYMGMAPGAGKLPALHSAFISNFNPAIVLLLGLVIYVALPNSKQILGLILALVGAYIYFIMMPGSGSGIDSSEGWGIILTVGSGFAWGTYQILTKHLTQKTDVFFQTTFAMGVGSIFLLSLALIIEGWPVLSLNLVILVVLLGTFNTALAYLLWNYAMKYLGTFEATVLQNSMLIQIAILSILFLDQRLYLNMLLGILLVLMGVFLVQIESLRGNAVRESQSLVVSRKTFG